MPEPREMTDVERLTEFWHTKVFGKFLDEAATDVLASLSVTAEVERLRAENERLRAVLEDIAAWVRGAATDALEGE